MLSEDLASRTYCHESYFFLCNIGTHTLSKTCGVVFMQYFVNLLVSSIGGAGFSSLQLNAVEYSENTVA
jgi:hypothetical protein